MNIVFVSNYFNHHQKPFCDKMYSLLEGNFIFISTTQMREERKVLGYGIEIPDYVRHSFIDEGAEVECQKYIDEADVVIAGSVTQKFIRNRIKEGKLVFRYSERPCKTGIQWWTYLLRFIKWHMFNPQRKPIFLLCASAYTAADYAKFCMFKNKTYRWGYFPELRRYDIDNLILNKNRKQILWCGRFLDWKHPDDAVKLALKLKQNGYDFDLNLIGAGELEDTLRKLILEYGLEESVHLLGAMKPEKVRMHMESTGIYLFTSDFKEGWGAVLNESMNSGCAVVASHAIGSVPFLLKHKENGLIYKSGDINDLYDKVTLLLDKPDIQIDLGKNAYNTLVKEWNAEIAAERLCDLFNDIINEGECNRFDAGPCARAEIIDNNWFD